MPRALFADGPSTFARRALISSSCSAGVSHRPLACIALRAPIHAARDPNGVEFIEVGRRDRQKSQPFQQGHARVFGLFQYAPVEASQLSSRFTKRAGPVRSAFSSAGASKGAVRKSVWVINQLSAGARKVLVSRFIGPRPSVPRRRQPARGSTRALGPVRPRPWRPRFVGRRYRTGQSARPNMRSLWARATIAGRQRVC